MDSEGIIVAGKYRLLECIGEGSFGEVFYAREADSTKEYAVKLELIEKKNSLLKTEVAVYKIFDGKKGFPRFYWSGTEGDYNVMVIELLGPNLESLMQHCGKKFSVSTTFALGQQMLEEIETFHSKELLHRDIKPENFAMGLHGNCNTVHILDYGLASRYINPTTGKHIPFFTHKKMVGTPRYCSLNAQMESELSRRDDLESLGYTLIYMLKGNLPWQGTRGVTREERNAKMVKLKRNLTDGSLLKGVPNELAQYMQYCRNLKFEEAPSYVRLHSLLSEVFFRNTCFKNFKYDWTSFKFTLKHKEAKGSADSAKVEYEGVARTPTRNMSRRLVIQKLVANTKVAEEPVLPSEETKEPRRSLAVQRVLLSMKSSSLPPESLLKTKKERSVSQGAIPKIIDKKLQYFMKSNIDNVEKTKQQEVEATVENQRNSLTFMDIPEELNDTIPMEKQDSIALHVPTSGYIHSSSVADKARKQETITRMKRTNTLFKATKVPDDDSIKKHSSNL